MYSAIFLLHGCSANKNLGTNVINIGFELTSYEKDNKPYTDVSFKFFSTKQETIFIGSYVGTGSHITSFKNRLFFNENSITGCTIFYAGGGDNIFAYVEGGKLIVKHIEFSLGSREEDPAIIKDEKVVTRNINNVKVEARETAEGNWSWIENNERSNFTVSIKKTGETFVGSYSAIMFEGRRIDTGLEGDISFKIKNFQSGEPVTFLNFYSGEKGKVKITLKSHMLYWEITEFPAKEFYCPTKTILKKVKQ
jgi:hypothetical protein